MANTDINIDIESNIVNKCYRKTILLEYEDDDFFKISEQQSLSELIEKNKNFSMKQKRITKKYAKSQRKECDLLINSINIFLEKIFNMEDIKQIKNNNANESTIALFEKYSKIYLNNSEIKVNALIKYNFHLSYQKSWNWEVKMKEGCDFINSITKNKKKRTLFYKTRKKIIDTIKFGIQFEQKYRDYLSKDNFQCIDHFDRNFFLEFFNFFKITSDVSNDVVDIFALFSKKKQKKIIEFNTHDITKSFLLNFTYDYKQKRIYK